MHKIKEMLHKDSEDSNVSSSSHSHSSSSSSSGEHGMLDKAKDMLSSNRDSKHEREIEHGGHQHTHTHTHSELEHQHLKSSGEHKHKELKSSSEHIHKEHKHKELKHSHEGLKHSHEKHIIHEREVLKDGGDLYKAGVDPTMNREVLHATTHDGGVKREIIDEGKIVKESIKEVELHKVQPVVHREREQKEIRHIVEPHKKMEIKDTEIHHRERDIDLGVRREASTLETSRDIGHAPHIESSREFLGKERQHQELPAKVEEHVHRKVEEHIHPVIYKEVLKPKVTEETHHIYEKVKEAPIETYEVKEIGTSRGLGLQEAGREFFARESSRGIILDEGHSCSRDIEHHHHSEHTHEHLIKDKSLKMDKSLKDKSLKKDKSHKHKHEHSDLKREVHISDPMPVHTHTHTHAAEPIIGHHQNIGAHHLPAGAVPAGHNMAYDAALAKSAVSSHSARDEGLMQKMTEKQIVQDEKLGRTQGNVV